MHPDISVFPRKRFYKDLNALLDLESPKPILEARNWGYDFYSMAGLKRSVWVDVKRPSGRGSKNIFEVEAMMWHLKKFLDYAVLNKPDTDRWEVACLAFYRGQEEMIRSGGEKFRRKNMSISDAADNNNHVDGLRAMLGKYEAVSSFKYENKALGPYKVHIRLCSVDRFQGHEADVVFLSMSQTDTDGFLDNPNRLNVSITRAKFQMLIFGKYDYFSERSKSEDLKELALAHKDSIMEWRSK
jgi:hypothetical protein